LDYAQLESRAGTPGADVIRILQKALDLQPDSVEARLRLGVQLTVLGSYSEALDHLRQIHKVNSDQAPSYFSALAYSYYRTGHPDDARKNAELAKKWARNRAEIDQADSLLRSLDASQAPLPGVTPEKAEASVRPPLLSTRTSNSDPVQPVLKHRPGPEFEVHEVGPSKNPFVKKEDQISHIEGVAQRLDCDGTAARFHVLVGQTSMVFEIPDPSAVLIKHSGEAHHDFTCGAQKPFRVAVDFAVKPDPKKGTAGIVRELDF
jgi:tetratricopeptide (TPR) repeat protein